MTGLTSEDLHHIRSITGLQFDTREPAKDPWNPNSQSFRYAADVLHALIGELEAGDSASECVEALRWEADRADADELALIYYPHLDATERAKVAEVWLATLTARRHEIGRRLELGLDD